MGRKSELTEEIIDNLVKLVAMGMYEGPAAEFLGIPSGALSQWKGRGGPLYDRLRTEISKAKASIELRLVNTIVKSAVGVNGVAPNVNDAKWLLPRMAPERWARREILEIEPKGKTSGERATLDLSQLTDEQLDNLEVMIKQALPPVRERLAQGQPVPIDEGDIGEGDVVSEQEDGEETWSAAEEAAEGEDDDDEPESGKDQ